MADQGVIRSAATIKSSHNSKITRYPKPAKEVSDTITRATHGGKGDSSRKGNNRAAYESGWDLAFGNHSPAINTQTTPTTPTQSTPTQIIASLHPTRNAALTNYRNLLAALSDTVTHDAYSLSILMPSIGRTVKFVTIDNEYDWQSLRGLDIVQFNINSTDEFYTNNLTVTINQLFPLAKIVINTTTNITPLQSHTTTNTANNNTTNAQNSH